MNLSSKPPNRSRAASHLSERPTFSKLHDCWSMDLVSDSLFDKRIRCLTIVDNYSRQCMAMYVGKGINGQQVIDALEQLRLFSGVKAKKIQVDNGSEFIYKEMDQWAYEQKWNLFSRDRENQLIMRILNRSMEVFAVNA